MGLFKEKVCKLSGVVWKQYNSLQKCICEKCLEVNRKQKIKPIKQYSDKRKELNKVYEKLRIEVLSEAKFKCFIDGCTNVANTVEHLMKRKGYADEWAKENNIPLLIDKRYLRACCLHHNGELERNPELSKKYQYSNVSGKKKSEL
jgi:hypothetical protein